MRQQPTKKIEQFKQVQQHPYSCTKTSGNSEVLAYLLATNKCMVLYVTIMT